jgi:metallo-beta-lactamase family protein
MRLVHHGGHEGVTGSCHQLWLDDAHSLLVDCGTFQGEDARRNPSPEIEFPLQGIEALLVTHVHIDHVGRIPYLYGAGFNKPLYCSRPTAELLPLMMEDTLKIGFTRNKKAIQNFLQMLRKHVRPVPYFKWVDGPAGSKLRFRPAGHVLGAAIIEVQFKDGRIAVFSGDLGASHSPLMKDFTSPERADLLLLESTYGDKLHEDRSQRTERLEAVLRHTQANGGTTIIPAFSLGRTQELLYELNGIFERLNCPRGNDQLCKIEVIIDSPLGREFTRLYNNLREYWGEEAREMLSVDSQPLVFDNLTSIGGHKEHLDKLDFVARRRVPTLVIAGSGMCVGGRVVNWLKRLLPEPTTDVVLVGFQARGTPGRLMQGGDSNEVFLDGRRVPVKARIHNLSGYSAHGDQADLVRFVEGFESRPKHIRLVHGEDKAKAALRELLQSKGYSVD